MPIQFGRYELLERISLGGMAEVFRAHVAGAAGFEKIVAIKRILPRFGADSRFIAMFIDDARISANLSHANIGQVYDFGAIDGQYFLCMEYIPGKDLAALQTHFHERGYPMPVAMVIRVGLDVAGALHYAHAKCDASGKLLRIVHRDISPPNVIVTYDGCIKLIDFGIAKAMSRTRTTATGLLKGKYGYLSPEQAEGKEVDSRSDLFSLGTVLFELATGERLFTAETEMGVVLAVRRAEVPSITDINPSVPAELEAIIRRALARDPGVRFQSAEELYEALDGFSKAAGLGLSNMQLARWMTETFRGPDDHAAPGIKARQTGPEQPSQPGVFDPTERPTAPGSGGLAVDWDKSGEDLTDPEGDYPTGNMTATLIGGSGPTGAARVAADLDQTSRWNEPTPDTDARALAGQPGGAAAQPLAESAPPVPPQVWEDGPTTVHLDRRGSGLEAARERAEAAISQPEVVLRVPAELESTQRDLPAMRADSTMPPLRPAGAAEEEPTALDVAGTVTLRELSTRDSGSFPTLRDRTAPTDRRESQPADVLRELEVSRPRGDAAPRALLEGVVMRRVDLDTRAGRPPAAGEAFADDLPSYVQPRRRASAARSAIVLFFLLMIMAACLVTAVLVVRRTSMGPPWLRRAVGAAEVQPRGPDLGGQPPSRDPRTRPAVETTPSTRPESPP